MKKAQALDVIGFVLEESGIPRSHWAVHSRPARIEFLRPDTCGHKSESARVKASWSAERILSELQAALTKPPEPKPENTEREILELTP